jgi:hypothetical protein
MPSETYFIRFRGRISGPFTLERLRGMANAGQLSPIHELSSDQSHWAPASSVAGLLPVESAAPVVVQPAAAAPIEQHMPADRWYFLNAEGNRSVPVTRDQLVECYNERQIDGNTPVWTNGMADWLPFSDAGLLATPGGEYSRRKTSRPRGGAGMGVASMVLGILALLSTCLIWIPFAGLVFLSLEALLGILAVVLGAAGLRRQGRGMAITGLTTGIIAVSLVAIMLIIMLVFVGSFAVVGPLAADN